MAIELKQSLKLSQQLLITPQLQQAIKLLQLSRAELVETVQKELLENPVLEEAADGSALTPDGIGETQRMTDMRTDSTVPAEQGEKNDGKEFDWAGYIESSHSRSSEGRNFSINNDELPSYENILSKSGSLQDHLDWQIQMSDLTDAEKEACAAVIGNIDDDGYLRSTLEEIAEKTNFTFDELDDALYLVQDLDPIGVGATHLRECLLLQIKGYGEDKKWLTEIINNHLPHIEKRDYLSLSKKLGTSLKHAKELAEMIFALEPKPGRAFSTNDAQYITPDVYVKKIGEDYVVILNEDGLPKLQISNFYKNSIMKEVLMRKNGANESSATDNVTSLKNDQAQNYIQEKLKGALWLIKSIHQRQKTLYKVTKSIVGFQKEFLEKGVQSLRPLVLREVADEIGMHESTVSRATNGKYVHTPQGIFELKYFFNTGLSHSAGGDDVANESVKQLVKQVIGTENLKSPLSDQAIAEILKTQNINIARRTVAKYREMLGILPSSRRKRMY